MRKEIHKYLQQISLPLGAQLMDNDLDTCFCSMDFRIWSRQIIKEYIVKGFVLDDERLKGNEPCGEEYFSDLLERIREISISERRNYQKITDIFAEFSCDYDKESIVADHFYQEIICFMKTKNQKQLLDLLEFKFINAAQTASENHEQMRMSDWQELLSSEI